MMIKWTLYAFCWVCCFVLLAAVFVRPEELGVLLNSWGLPGAIADIFLANRGVQIVTALSLTLMIGYGIPFIISSAITLARLDKASAAIIAARRETRSLATLEGLALMHPGLMAHLLPVATWASEQADASGEVHVVARRSPSERLSAARLSTYESRMSAFRFLPKFHVLFASVIVMLMLAHSADRAFAEILSVSGTDYGTMILGLRSAAAAMSIALLAALLIWTLQKIIDWRYDQLSNTLIKGLEALISYDDSETVELMAPLADFTTPHEGQIERQLQQIHKKISELASAKSNGAGTAADDRSFQKLSQIIAQNDEKQLSLLAAVQQSMAELQAVRQDVDMLRGAVSPALPTASNDPAVGKLTSAIRALKDSADSALPQL